MASNRSRRRAPSNPATGASGPTQAAPPPHFLDLAQIPPDLACPARRRASGRVTAAALVLSACGPAVGKQTIKEVRALLAGYRIRAKN